AVFAVGVLWLDGGGDFVARLLAQQGLFQAGDDVTCPVQVHQWRGASGAVNHLTSIVGKGIVDGDGLVGGNQHGAGPLQKNEERPSLPKARIESDRSAHSGT